MLSAWALRAGRGAPDMPARRDDPSRPADGSAAIDAAAAIERGLERRIVVGFGFALIVLVTLAALSYWSVRSLLENRADAERARRAIDDITQVRALVRESDSSVRGFLLTARESDLRRYAEADARLDAAIAALGAGVRDDAVQRASWQAIVDTTRTMREAVRDTIAARRATDETLAGALYDASGHRDAMERLRGLLAGMVDHERSVLADRTARVDRAASFTLTMLPAGSVIAVLVTAISFLAIRRELRHRHALEAATRDLNRDLELSNRELERSNRELQDFAYVASHDLQEPLRKIQAFGDRLVAKHGAALDEQAQDYLRRMLSAARRMQALINDLLTYSRVSTRGAPFAPVDLARVASEVLADLEVQIERSGGEVRFDPLPTIDADATQMRQLLQNLVSNALKFRDPDRAPHVAVTCAPFDAGASEPPAPRAAPSSAAAARAPEAGAGAAAPHGADAPVDAPPTLASRARPAGSASALGDEPTDSARALSGLAAHPDAIEITVRDNGIGFDEKYLDRIFTPFQRLHGRDRYEGTGIGLAVCRRIVERHGGFITARSTPGAGSAFRIVLPRHHAEDTVS